MKKSDKNRRGQTIIEFALVSIAFIFMLVLTINVVLAFSVQQYLSYAAFMTARAFQASGASSGDASRRALNTIARYIPGMNAGANNDLRNLNIPLKFQLFAKPLARIDSVFLPTVSEKVIGQDHPRDGSAVQIVFAVPLVQFPLSRELSSRFSTIELRATSYLGREVSQRECQDYFKNFLAFFVLSDGANPNNATASKTDGKYMEDNGC